MATLYEQLARENQKKEGGPSFRPMEKNEMPRLLGIKIIMVGAFLLSFAALAGSVFLFQSVNSEKRAREALEASQVQFQEMVQSLQSETENYRTEMERMRSQLKSYLKEKDSLTKELEQNGIEISGLKKKIYEFETRNQAGTGPTTAIEGVLDSAAPSSETAAAPLASEASQPKGELPPVIETTQEPVPAKIPRVMTVNRKFNFVVVNLGARDNLKMGDQLNVEKKGKKVAIVQVEKLYEDFAAATILEEDKNSPIKDGDGIAIVQVA